MRIMVEVPDRVASDAVRERRTVRQHVEYLVARALAATEQPPAAAAMTAERRPAEPEAWP